MEKSKCCIAWWIAGILLVGAAVVLVAAYAILIHVRIAVDEASLTKFELVSSSSSSSPAIAYNLSLTLTIHNPNWAITIKNKKKLEASYSFDGQVFDRVLVAEKGDKQGAKKTRVYHLAVASSANGTVVPGFGNAGVTEFTRQNKTGFFDVEVKVAGKFQYTARLTKCELDATCPLKLQLAPPGTKAVVFEKVKCKLAKAKKYC